jgi:hypothetical protein
MSGEDEKNGTDVFASIEAARAHAQWRREMDETVARMTRRLERSARSGSFNASFTHMNQLLEKGLKCVFSR